MNDAVKNLISDQHCICRLCQRSKPLQRSHVLPEFLYKPMYNDKHQYFEISPDPSVKISVKQKGLRERLLCFDCEQHLNTYETYIKEVIYDGKHVESSFDGERINLSGLDYKKTRLYYLSILWRMSISDKPMFKEVSLSEHEEKIRLMLINENPGEPDEYGVLSVVPIIKGTNYIDWHREPEHRRYNGYHLYLVVIGGIFYIFSINPKTFPMPIRSGFLQKNGSWMTLIADVHEIDFLNNWFGVLVQGHRDRTKAIKNS